MVRKFQLFIFLMLICCNARSQSTLSVRSMSMGNTSVSNSYEIDAFNQNPANLLYQRSNNNAVAYFQVLTNLGVRTSSSYLSFDFYNNYFTKLPDGNTRELTDEEKNTILNEAGNQTSGVLASVKLASFVINTKKIGTFGFSINERFTENFRLSRDFLDLALFGNLALNAYDFSETKGNAYWTRELNFSYAYGVDVKKNKLFDALSFGVSIKPQFGLYYVQTTKNNLKVITNNLNNIQGVGTMNFVYSGLTSNNEFKYSLNNAGTGLGFDIGVNAGIKNVSKRGKLNFGLSITDVGSISWEKNSSTYFYDGNFVITDITNKQQIDSLRDRIKGTKTPAGKFSVDLPATLRAGATFKWYDKGAKKDSIGLERASISLDYIQCFNDNLGASKKGIIGLGIEVNATNVLSPRAGFAIGGVDNFVASFGLGIDTGPVLIDLGTNNIESIFRPKGTTKLSGGLSIRYKIN